MIGTLILVLLAVLVGFCDAGDTHRRRFNDQDSLFWGMVLFGIAYFVAAILWVKFDPLHMTFTSSLWGLLTLGALCLIGVLVEYVVRIILLKFYEWHDARPGLKSLHH